MNLTRADKPRSGAIKPRLMLLPALVVGLSLAFTGAASASTAFQADVTWTGPAPAGCPAGAYICGTANIAGYGAATWTMYPTVTSVSLGPCGSTYAATTYFTFVSDPGSTLVLDEVGGLCGLGNEGAAYRGYFAEGPNAAGHPFAFVGNWTVDPASTLAGFDGLSGTDVVNTAGMQARGSYSGTLGP